MDRNEHALNQCGRRNLVQGVGVPLCISDGENERIEVMLTTVQHEGEYGVGIELIETIDCEPFYGCRRSGNGLNELLDKTCISNFCAETLCEGDAVGGTEPFVV
jgi:hypothetical protein